jgi:hypothetical protein
MEEDPGFARHIRDSVCDIAIVGPRIEVKVFAGNLEEEHVKRIVSRVQQVAGDKRYPILVIPDKNTRITFFAVRVLASEEAQNYALATAYIIRSFHHQLMAEALFTMYNASRPIKVFTEEPMALKWLESFA